MSLLSEYDISESVSDDSDLYYNVPEISIFEAFHVYKVSFELNGYPLP